MAYSPPVYTQAVPDPGWLDFDSLSFPTCTPRDLSNASDPHQPPLGDQTNYPEQLLSEFSQSMSADASDKVADTTFEYATGDTQHTAFPHLSADISEQPTTFLPSFYPAQYLDQDAPYPTSDIVPPFDITSMTAPFTPFLPPNPPPYPLAQSTSMAPQESSQRPENRLNRSPQAALSVPTSCSAGRKRKQVEKAETMDPPSKRMRTKQHEKYPAMQAGMIKFAVNPSRPHTTSPVNIGKHANPRPPPADHGSQPATWDTALQAERPAGYPVTLFQVPFAGLSSLNKAAHKPAPAHVQPANKHLAFIRVDHLVYGRHNAPLPGLPKGVKLIVSLYRGAALDERRRQEGVNFYGNELCDPRTGAHIVLRIDPARAHVETGVQGGFSMQPLPFDTTAPLSFYNAGQNLGESEAVGSIQQYGHPTLALPGSLPELNPSLISDLPDASELQGPPILQSDQQTSADVNWDYVPNYNDSGATANPSSFQFFDNYLV